jgi:serine/threonine protein kinase
LEFLHLNTKSQTIVPHGNLKSSNVLLDENDMVLVSDYGLASLVALPIATQRMVSYKSPEYQTAKRVSKQSDVWSYGCLLLELLTAKIPAMAAPPGINGVYLSSWIHRALREEWTAEVFDLELSMKRSATPGMVRLLQIALRCCDNVPEERPEMTEVVREVEHIKAPPDQSEDEDDLSLERSINDDSITTTAAGIVGDDER